MSEWQDDAARVDPSGVEVHSVYGVDPTLQILDDIKERDGWSGEGGEQQADAVERPGDWPASVKVRPSCPARRCCDPDAAPETDDN